MTTADEPGKGGVRQGTGAERPPAPVPENVMDDAPLDDGTLDDKVLDAELLDDELTEGSMDDPLETDATEVAEADPLELAEAERDEYLDSLRRLQAEFENYKKRVLKQQTEQLVHQ